MNRLALIDENVLAYKYLSEKKPIRVVANEMGVAVGTVYNHLQKLGIETRKITDYPVTEKQREAWRKIGQKRKGEKMSEAAKKKISEAHKQGGIGHKKKRGDGYIAIYFPDHPKASKDGYIMEHILVMEALIGRHLKDDECVHHIDENRQNNKKENLELMTISEHMSYHSAKRHKERRDDL